MSETAALPHDLSREEFAAIEPKLHEELLDAQFELAQRRDRTVLILVNGSDGAGKGELLDRLNWWLDPFMTTSVPANRVAAPVLALAGGLDLIHPPITVRQTAARLSGEIIVFEKMSHWLIGEPGWEEVAEVCIGWLDRL